MLNLYSRAEGGLSGLVRYESSSSERIPVQQHLSDSSRQSTPNAETTGLLAATATGISIFSRDDDDAQATSTSRTRIQSKTTPSTAENAIRRGTSNISRSSGSRDSERRSRGLAGTGGDDEIEAEAETESVAANYNRELAAAIAAADVLQRHVDRELQRHAREFYAHEPHDNDDDDEQEEEDECSDSGDDDSDSDRGELDDGRVSGSYADDDEGDSTVGLNYDI
jgi:hypothetical protein